LATGVGRELGRRWLAAAPAPRRGFRARPGLRATLARIGRQPQTAPREQKNLARGRGRQALVRARRLFPAEEACLRGLRVEPEEAVAVQTLEGLSPEQSAGPRPELLRILLRASSARPAQLDVSLALGRLLRGAEGGGGSGLERTGRELSEWVDATCPD